MIVQVRKKRNNVILGCTTNYRKIIYCSYGTSCRNFLPSGFLRLPRIVALPFATFQHARDILSQKKKLIFKYDMLMIRLQSLNAILSFSTI